MDESQHTHTPATPSVSVAMTTFNGEKFLARQLDSIFSQTLLPKEIVICDDCSTDNTIEILKAFSRNAPVDFTYHQNETQMGVTANFKKAVSLTTPGNYIALSDQDDIWLPQKLERSVQALVNIDNQITPALVYSDLIMIDGDENILNTSVNNVLAHDKYVHCLSTLLFGNFVLGCTVVMNEKMKQFFKDIPDNTPFNHDSWLSLIGFSFGKTACMPEAFIHYRKHDANISFTDQEYRKSRTGRIWNHLKSILTNQDFLEKQIILAKSFLEKYEPELNPEQRALFANFTSLENASYLRKKIAFEKAFKNNWIRR